MRKGNFLKTMVFSLGVAAMLLPAKTLNAQNRPGGLFGTNVIEEEEAESGMFQRGSIGGGGGFFIHPQTFLTANFLATTSTTKPLRMSRLRRP